MRRLRLALAAQSPDAALRASIHLPLERFANLTIVGGYRAQGAEIDPLPLMDRLAAAGAALALPAATNRRSNLDYRRIVAGAPLALDAFGIPSPPASSPSVRPDLVILPILAFDRNGGRLGQGAGAFDRTLEALRAEGPVFVLGLAYAGQEVDHVPREAHDQPLDAILTEKAYGEVSEDS